MTLWLRVRRAQACIATIVLVAIALVPFRDLSLPLPDLLTGLGLSVPFSLLLPLAVVIVVAWGLTSGDPLLEVVASRPRPMLDTAFAVAISVIALSAGVAAWAVGGTHLAIASGRNALGYVGLMLIGRRLIGPLAAPLLPIGFTMLAALFGMHPYRQPRWWAWPLAGASDVSSWVIAIAVMVVGAGLTLMAADAAATER